MRRGIGGLRLLLGRLLSFLGGRGLFDGGFRHWQERWSASRLDDSG